jgi:hypothetical protein
VSSKLHHPSLPKALPQVDRSHLPPDRTVRMSPTTLNVLSTKSSRHTMRTIVILMTLAALGTNATTASAGSNAEQRRRHALEQAQQNVERWQQFQRDTNATLDQLRDQLTRSMTDTDTPSAPEPSYDDSEDND